jgi:repressor LexA
MTNAQIIGANIRRLRERASLSQVEIAEIAGVTPTAVSAWETGVRTPRMGPINKIAEYFRVNTSDIIESPQTAKPNGIRIPIFDGARLGPPRESTGEVLDWLELGPEYVRRGELVAVKVYGDSMSPRIVDGDIVIVKVQPTADNGDIVIAFIENGSTCKYLHIARNGIKLIPYNSNYDPMFFTNEEIASLPVTIYGKVIELRRRF